MKRAITGLLLFSGAAQGAVADIDKTNYNRYLCDDNLFKPTRLVNEREQSYSPFVQINANRIKDSHERSCYLRENYLHAYEEAQEIGLTAYSSGCPNAPGVSTKVCVETTGLAYAKSCEELRIEKRNNPAAWNNSVVEMEPCVRPGLRR